MGQMLFGVIAAIVKTKNIIEKTWQRCMMNAEKIADRRSLPMQTVVRKTKISNQLAESHAFASWERQFR